MLMISSIIGIVCVILLALLTIVDRKRAGKLNWNFLLSLESNIFKSYRRAVSIHLFTCLGLNTSVILMEIELNLISQLPIQYELILILSFLALPYAYIYVLLSSEESEQKQIQSKLDIARVIEGLANSDRDDEIEVFLTRLFDNFESQKPPLRRRFFISKQQRMDYFQSKTTLENRNDRISELFNKSLQQWKKHHPDVI